MDEKASAWPILEPQNVSTFLEESDWNMKLEVKLEFYKNNCRVLIKQDLVLGVFQEFKDDHPMQCDRGVGSSRNLMKEDPSLFTTSIPHTELSGRCFTYK